MCSIVYIEGNLRELYRFHGIIVTMLYKDTIQHRKPHVHVKYGDHTACIGIDGELLGGDIPAKQLKMIQTWLIINKEELHSTWKKAIDGQYNY